MSPETHSEIEQSSPDVENCWPDLVRRVRAGDSCAMEELYHLFSTGIRFYLCRQLGPQDLDDKVHDIFLIITQSIQRGDLREPERLMGYVRTIVRRQVAAYIEIAVNARRNHSDADFSLTLSDQHPNPERRLIAAEATAVALSLLKSLHKRDREVLIRFYLKEQNPEQICHEMKLSETQFPLIKSRAKARFGELGKRRMAQRAKNRT